MHRWQQARLTQRRQISRAGAEAGDGQLADDDLEMRDNRLSGNRSRAQHAGRLPGGVRAGGWPWPRRRRRGSRPRSASPLARRTACTLAGVGIPQSANAIATVGGIAGALGPPPRPNWCRRRRRHRSPPRPPRRALRPPRRRGPTPLPWPRSARPRCASDLRQDAAPVAVALRLYGFLQRIEMDDESIGIHRPARQVQAVGLAQLRGAVIGQQGGRLGPGGAARALTPGSCGIAGSRAANRRTWRSPRLALSRPDAG